MNGIVSTVNSTAVVSNVQPSYNGTVLRCLELADLSMFSEAVLRVAGKVTAICIVCIIHRARTVDIDIALQQKRSPVNSYNLHKKDF